MQVALDPHPSLTPSGGMATGMAARRRSSAASRPALPPPSLPIPPLPDSPEIPRRTPAHEELDDPPPPSNLNHGLLAAPEARPEPRIPSSRRALTRALELAREAVQLDSTNEEPEAAVIAYARSVALLSEVMERVRRGEDSTERRKNGRPRSAVAQEEEVRRLQNIHDTYADRMNILSIIYNIPPIPYSVTHEYSVMAAEASAQPSSITSPVSPTEGAELFAFDNGGSGAHPYAVAAPSSYEEPPTVPRRRPRAGSAAAMGAPPKPPPPTMLPPAPAPPPADPNLLDVSRPASHRRTNSGSRLAALEEETRDEPVHNGESPPLPPAPSPTIAARQPAALPRPPPSPRPITITPRPRGSSQVVPRTEVALGSIINGSPNSGTIHLRRKQPSTPASERSSSPAESTTSINSNPVPKANGHGRPRSVSQPGRRPPIVNGRISPTTDPLPPLPDGVSRKASVPSKLGSNPNNLSIVTNPSSLGPGLFAAPNNPTTPTSPLPPAPPSDPLRKPYHMMHLLRMSMTSTTGGYLTRRLHVPYEVWSQGGAKLTNIAEKIRVVDILYGALDDLQTSSSEHFGAGNVSSGLALGIGSIGRKEGEAWLSRLEDFSNTCDGVVANFGKKLGVGEGFVVKKSTLAGKLTRRFDKLTTGKNLDSPQTYVTGLARLFEAVQLLDEHSKAITAQPVAPAYAALPPDIRAAADNKLKRASQFFATVVLTFVIRDLSLLLDKYAKKCEKWLAE